MNASDPSAVRPRSRTMSLLESLEGRTLFCEAHGILGMAGGAAAIAESLGLDSYAAPSQHDADPHEKADAATPPEARLPLNEPPGGTGAGVAAVGDPMLPDMFALASQAQGYIYGWNLDFNQQPGRTLLRLSTAMANRGRGAMELRGSTTNPDGTQNVNQRVYLEGGGFQDRLAGTFSYHPGHGHIHFDGFASYHLREVTAGDGVGDVLASGSKVSFCLLDIDHFNPALPGSPATGVYGGCGQIQGISAGWADVYHQSLPDQWIDITGIADGRYWLEVIADPDNHLLESDETNNTTRVLINLDVPTSHPRVSGHNPTGAAPPPASSVDFDFNERMNTTSFSVADDVLSFNGPGGVSLLDQVTGFTWVDNDTLRVQFNAQSAEGSYSMVIGPQILADDDGNPMDQDGDESPGEAVQDRYTATFSLDTCIGPDGFGYEACATTYEPINLVRGAAGVFVIQDNVDDNPTAAVNLGANSFSFYGTTYTGSNALHVSSNGLITFGSGNASLDNGDLTSNPSQRGIAVLWDDLVTDADANDVVLGKFEDTDGNGASDRLIIEWSQVRRYGPSPSDITFQAVFQLNTGTRPGDVVLNYVDLESGNEYRNGAQATVGIKDTGVQGTRRLLVSQNNGRHAFLGSGKAIRIGVHPATVAGRHLFYNRSAFDGYSPALGAADDGALASDKSALLPGAAPAFANVSGYSRGINGVMVDLAGLNGRTPTFADFSFAGTPAPGSATAAVWEPAPPPMGIAVRRGAGVGGSDRVTLVWPDGAIRNRWLEVTVRPTGNTLLAASDVFYFANLVGDGGTTDAWSPNRVSAADVMDTRRAMHNGAGTVTSAADHNRDGRVDVRDLSLARGNLFKTLPVLWDQSAPGATTAPAGSTSTAQSPPPPDARKEDEDSVSDSVLN